MRGRTILKRTLWLTAVLALMCLAALAALAEDPLDNAKFSQFVTTQENVWVEIPADSKAASWDVALWKAEGAWERLFYRDNVTAAGKVTLETAGKLPEGVYALSVVQYDSKDALQTEFYRAVNVYTAKPAQGEVRVTLSTTAGSKGDKAIAASVWAPGATSGVLVFGGNRMPFKGESQTSLFGYGRQSGSIGVYAVASYPDGSTKTSAKQTVTVSEKGTLGAWEPTGMPSGKISGNAEVRVHIPPVANTSAIVADGTANIDYYFELYDMDEEVVVQRESFAYKREPGDRASLRLIGDGVDVTIPAERLVAGHNYNCYLDAVASGYGYAYRSTLFAVGSAADAKLTLTINGENAGPLKMACGEDFTVKVNLPKEATAMRIYCGDHFEYMNQWDEWEEAWKRKGAVEMEWSLWDAAQYTFYAQAYYGQIPEDADLEALDWGGATSNVIAVTGEDTVNLPIPAFTLDKSQVVRGDVVVATVTDWGEGAEGVNAYLTSQDTGREYYDFRMSGNTIRIPTAVLEPGSYILAVENYARGKWGSAAYTVFNVAAPAAADKPVLSLSAAEIPTHEQVRVQVFAEGAERIDVYVMRPEGDVDDHRDYDGDTMDDRFGGYGDPGTFTVTAVADYGGRTEKVSQKFRVRADKGSLKPITIDAAPEILKVGEDATIQFTADSNAGWVWLGLHRLKDGWEYMDSMDVEAGSGSATFDGSLFSEPGNYVIRIDTNQDGYRSNHLNWNLRVVEEAKKPTLELTVNGGTKPVTAKSGERYSVEVKAPGATALRVLNENGEWDYRLKDDRPEHYMERWESGESQSFTLVAEACYDKYNLDKYRDKPEELNWSAVSNEVRVTVLADSGSLELPDASLSAESVAQGGKLTLTIKPQKLSGVDVEYGMNVQRRESEEDYQYLFHMPLGTDPGAVTLPTNALEPGAYRAEINADAKGYVSSRICLPFTVTKASNPKKVQVMASRTKVKASEQVFIVATAIGADRTELVMTRKGDKDWDDDRSEDGERVEDDYRFNEKGTYYVTPIGHYGKKEVKGEKITITVTASGSLKEAKLSFPPVILMGQPLEGTFKAVSGAENYWVDVDWSPEEGDWDHLEDYDIPDGVRSVSFMASVFTRPGRYSVQLNARAVGKDASYARHYFAVVDPDKVLVLPAKLTSIGEEAFMGVDAQLIVVPKGVKKIDSRAFADCKNLLAVIIPGSVKKVAKDAFDGCPDGLIRAESY